jgi:hypothetical protein
MKENSGFTSKLVFNSETKRRQLILETLARISAVFAEADQLEYKYGIRHLTAPGGGGGTFRPASSVTLSSHTEHFESRSLRAGFRRTLKTFLGRELDNVGSSDFLQVSPPHTPDVSYLSPVVFSTSASKFGPAQLFLESVLATDLDINIGLAEMERRRLEHLAQEYQSKLSAYGHLEWEVCRRDNLQTLISDLKEYNDALAELTKKYFEDCKPPTPRPRVKTADSFRSLVACCSPSFTF